MKTDKLKFLKVGGHYRVKSFARLMKEYGPDGSSEMPDVRCGFNAYMKRLCGQKVTVYRKFDGYDKYYHITEAGYCWNSQMLELLLSTLIYRRRHG